MFSILEQCDQLKDKLLVFSQSLDVLSLIEKMLKMKIKKTMHNTFEDCWVKNKDYFRIDGSVSPDERQSIIEQINDEENDVARLLLLSTKAGGIGINLVGANRAIIFDTCWNPSHDVQAVYRIFRYGQKKPVFVYRFAAAGTMESKIYKRQITKQSIALRVLDELQIERYYTATDLHELYDLEVDQSEERLLLPVKDPMLAKLFLAHRNSITSYHEHDSLLENRPEEDLSNKDREDAWEEFLRQQKEEGLKVATDDGREITGGSGNFAAATSRTSLNQRQQTFIQKSYDVPKDASGNSQYSAEDEKSAESSSDQMDEQQVSSSNFDFGLVNSDGQMHIFEDSVTGIETTDFCNVPDIITLDSDEDEEKEKEEEEEDVSDIIILDSDEEMENKVIVLEDLPQTKHTHNYQQQVVYSSASSSTSCTTTVHRSPKFVVTSQNGQLAPDQVGFDWYNIFGPYSHLSGRSMRLHTLRLLSHKQYFRQFLRKMEATKQVVPPKNAVTSLPQFTVSHIGP